VLDDDRDEEESENDMSYEEYGEEDLIMSNS
jgi:hypothetical protein